MKNPTERRWNWASAILLLLMMQAATARLVVTEWTQFLFFTQTLAALGLALGLALGYSIFKRRAVILLALGYSLMLLPWQMTLAIDDELLSSRLASVGGRLYFALVQFFQREPVEDNLLFVAFISVVIWIISIVSGYWWTRHENYLAAVLPGGIFVLVIHLYDQFFSARIWILAIYLFLAMLLLGQLYYLKNRESWRKRRVFQMQESTFDFSRGMVITATLFIIVAWTVPATHSGFESAIQQWNRITEPWRLLFEDRVNCSATGLAWGLAIRLQTQSCSLSRPPIWKRSRLDFIGAGTSTTSIKTTPGKLPKRLSVSSLLQKPNWFFRQQANRLQPALPFERKSHSRFYM
jgi:hypothetical protein